MKLRVDRFQIGDEAQVTLGRGQGKVRISQQKESAGSLGRTARGGDMTICCLLVDDFPAEGVSAPAGATSARWQYDILMAAPCFTGLD